MILHLIIFGESGGMPPHALGQLLVQSEALSCSTFNHR